MSSTLAVRLRLTPVVASADQADILRGLGGNNMLFGRSGNDTLEGGLGADTLIGGPGMDTADYSASAAAVSVNLRTGLARVAMHKVTFSAVSRTSSAAPSTTRSRAGPAMARSRAGPAMTLLLVSAVAIRRSIPGRRLIIR